MFRKATITFYSHTLTDIGIPTDPEEILANANMSVRTDANDVLHFNVMINRFSRFLPKLTVPMRTIRRLTQGGEVDFGRRPAISH